MDSQRLPGCETIHHRLGSVSDRPLIVGSTVEQMVRTYVQAFRPVLDSHRLGPAARGVLGSAGSSSIKHNDSS